MGGVRRCKKGTIYLVVKINQPPCLYSEWRVEESTSWVFSEEGTVMNRVTNQRIHRSFVSLDLVWGSQSHCHKGRKTDYIPVSMEW